MYMGYELCLQVRYATNASEQQVEMNAKPERDDERISLGAFDCSGQRNYPPRFSASSI